MSFFVRARDTGQPVFVADVGVAQHEGQNVTFFYVCAGDMKWTWAPAANFLPPPPPEWERAKWPAREAAGCLHTSQPKDTTTQGVARAQRKRYMCSEPGCGKTWLEAQDQPLEQ